MQPEAMPLGTGMEAQPDDPEIGVYVLSQFVFCPRAGVCAFEGHRKGDSEDPPNICLDYMPRYDLYEVEKSFNGRLTTTLVLVCGTLVSAWLAHFLITTVHPDWAYAGMASTSVLAILSIMQLPALWELARRRFALQWAKAREPDPQLGEPQPVNWCELLKAGFMYVPYRDWLEHPQWKLTGKPWRVLRRGNLRIPVFRQAEGDPKLHVKHLAKAAAYCHLLQTAENASSPFAIILKENSFDGVAVMFNAKTRKILHEALRRARAVLRSVKTGAQSPAAPERTSLCSGCPFGNPVPFRPGESQNYKDGIPLPIFEVASSQQEMHHSHCGDRFGWLPPHELAKEKGLKPLVQS